MELRNTPKLVSKNNFNFLKTILSHYRIHIGKLTYNQHEHSKNVTWLGKEIIFSKRKELSLHRCPQIQICQKQSLISMEYIVSELYGYMDLIFSSSVNLQVW